MTEQATTTPTNEEQKPDGDLLAAIMLSLDQPGESWPEGGDLIHFAAVPVGEGKYSMHFLTMGSIAG